MGVIGRREFQLIMTMDDQTKREREALNRGMGDIEKTTKKAAKESEAAIVQMAKASKQNLEGIKAVMELGGWLMMAQQVGKAFMDITAEARKNSQAFKEAGAALEVVKNKIGESLVKALEPLAKGFTEVLRYGTAVFQNFPAVAQIAFRTARDLLARAFEPATLQNIFSTLGAMIVGAMKAAFQAVPALFDSILMLIAPKLMAWIDWIKEQVDHIKKGELGKLEKYDDAYIAKHPIQQGSLGDVMGAYKGYLSAEFGVLLKGAKDIGANFKDITDRAGREFSAVLEPSLAAFDDAVATKLVDDGAPQVAEAFTEGMKEGIRNISWDDIALNKQFQEGLARQAEEAAMFSQPEQIIGAAATNPLSDIFVSLMNAAAPFIDAIKGLGAVTQLLNPLQTIFNAMMEVLGPIINNLLAPLVGILKIVGYTIGKILAPALELLRPVIEFVATLFTWLYNKVVVPVANVIITAFNWIYNGFADFINGILWLIDQIPFVDVGRVTKRDMSAGTLTEITTDMVGAAGATSGSSGGSASYAAGTSITIEKIEIKADFIAGDAGLMDVAVMLRDKLLEAERAGR